MEAKNTLNGFEAILDTLNPHVGTKTKIEDNDTDVIDAAAEELTDEELEALRNPKPKKTTKVEDDELEDEDNEEEDEDVTSKPKKTTKTQKKSKSENTETNEDEDEGGEQESNSNNTDGGNDTSDEEIIVGFFDSLASQLGWDDVEDDEKPRTAEDLINYFKEVIEENSTPQYASEEVEKLDKFVHNGGKLKDYFSIDADLDIDNIEIEDDEVNQKLVIKEFLKEKGFTSKQIEKKLNKYEEAGLLEDEATDALEALRDIKVARKEELLANQEKQAREAEKQQRDFFNNVVTEIKGMDSIYGIDIPEKDKKALLEYIFKPDADGITRYQKDYAKSLKNLITSAYFTMKGDALIDIAKKKGKKDAIDNFKNTLSRNSGVSKKSKRQVINNDSNSSIWDAFARQLRVA